MIYIGTCGFSYKDWIGTFYPGTVRPDEMLSYYASSFKAVEIDSSFYGVLQPQTVERMNARTPADFRFCFKVPQTVSHAPDAAQGRIHDDARAFVESVAPIADSGKFGCALLQFPNGFKPNERTEAYVRAAVEALQPLPVTVEFRNRDWQTPRYFDMISGLHAGWCNVDMPGYETLMRASSDVSSDVAYVRFHGRNAAKWWTGDNRTRYDYNYTAEELEPWGTRVAEMEERAKTTFAFFNNHARGNAARNAELFIDLMRERYGSLADEIMPERSRPPGQQTLFD
ncbi:MAG TPA: DUF72 domain-containing protein [Candidatus Baltobacteraceae bacterium]|nr:DUF72 domain-containing protein [Candidatus Baltobacteraceae bacterium]